MRYLLGAVACALILWAVAMVGPWPVTEWNGATDLDRVAISPSDLRRILLVLR